VTFALFRRDAALRSLPAWTVISAIIASALEGLRTFLAQASGPEGLPTSVDSLLLVVIFWLPLAAYLTFGRTNQRCSRFDLTLPISARRMWWIHLVTVASSGIVLLLVVAGVLRMRDGLFALLADGSLLPESDLAALAPALVACLLLAVASLQATEPALYRIPTRGRYLLLSLLGSLVALGLLIALAVLPRLFSLVVLGLAGLVVWRGSLAIPAGFTLIPHQPERGNGEDHTDSKPSESGWAGPTPERRGALARQLFVSTTAFGILSRGIAPGALWEVPTSLAQLPLMLGWGLLFSGVFFGEPDIWIFFIVITVYLLLALLAGPMNQIYLLDPLPISRRRIFGLLVLPGFLALAAGYGLGVLMTPSEGDAGPSIELTAGISRLAPHYRLESPMVRVPSEYLAVAMDGTLPSIEAPWGESHEPWSISVARGTRALLYSPYSTPEGSSRQFVALQLSRAIETVYGASLSADEVERRLLDTDESGGVVWSKEAFSAWLTDEGIRPRRNTPLFPFVLTLVGVMWLITVWAYLPAFRSTRSSSSRKWAFFGLLGVLLAVHLAATVAAVGAVTRPWVAAGVSRLAVRRLAEVVPAGEVGVWLGGIAIMGIVYVWVQHRFESIEAAPPRTAQEV